MRCFKATIEYDGTDLHGFQYQVGQRTVQGDLEAALAALTGGPVRVHGAGRTDAGVHALGQVVGFRAETRIPTERLAAAMNSALPRDIRVVAAEEVDEGFHARFSARGRVYVYVVLNRDQASAVFGRYTWHVPGALDVEAMAKAAGFLEGVHDFRAWANETSEVDSTVREVTRCSVRRARGVVLVRVEANAFLRGMVRNIVGTLVQVGQGRRRPEEFGAITASLRRDNAGPSAPAQGLCLVKVLY